MHEMALVHYHGHLNIARELKDSACEALALCNLGSCHAARSEFSQVSIILILHLQARSLIM